MQDVPLSLTQLLRHGQLVHRRSRVMTFDGTSLRSATFADVAERAERLAAGLADLGVGEGDRVATLMWNSQEHLELYLAVPCMGAVLHTVNLRLPPEHLVHVLAEAADRVVVVHATVAPVLSAILPRLSPVEHVVVVDDAPLAADVAAGLGVVGRYEELLAGAGTWAGWRTLDERSAAVICHTSGTTGEPLGVVYSHRSMWLHTLNLNNCGSLTFDERQRILLVVPQFHVNAWGYPYAAWINGADIVMPSRFLQGAALAGLVELARPTIAPGVPTVWADLLRHVREHPGTDLSSLREINSGGA